MSEWRQCIHFRGGVCISEKGQMMKEKDFLRIGSIFLSVCSFVSSANHEPYMRILRIYGQNDLLKMSSGSWGLSGCFLFPFLPSLFISILHFSPFLPLPFLSSLFPFASSHCRFTLWRF